MKKKGNNKKLKVEEVSELENCTEAVSSLVAFINKTRSTKFDSLQDMHDYYQEKAQLTTENNKRPRLAMEESDDSSDSSDSDNTSSSESTGNKKAKAKNANQLRRIRLDSQLLSRFVFFQYYHYIFSFACYIIG